MTPAIKLLQKQDIAFSVLSYEHDNAQQQYGLEAVEKLQLNAAQVFKTLVLQSSEGEFIVAITPVSQTINLKQLARVHGCKKLTLAEVNKVVSNTGYIIGGVSPLGQKKRLTSYIHQTAKTFDIVYVSAGRRGLEIALSPTDLIVLTSAQYAQF